MKRTLWLCFLSVTCAANAAPDSSKMPVHLVDQNGKQQQIDPKGWYLTPLNRLRQALPADSEKQCKQMLEKLPKNSAVCKPGSKLTPALAE